MSHIYSYGIGILFLVLYVIFLQFTGSIFVDQESSFSKRFIIGYIFFTFLWCIGGLFTQFLQLKVIYFYLYCILVISILLIISIRKKNLNLNFQNIKEHFKNCYLIYICLVLLVFLSIQNIELQWLSNHLDDGRYLNLAANYFKMDNPYLTDPATGLPITFDFMRAFNTFELETSFWIWFLHIEPTIFTRMILMAFNYFLILNSIVYFANLVVKSCNFKVKKSWVQFSVLPIFIFMISSGTLRDGLLFMQDDWQFISAIWYGSSIVRIPGIFIILTPIIDRKYIEIRSVIFYIIVSFVMMTRASQALSILLLISISYLIVMNFYQNKKKGTILGFLIMAIFILLSFAVNLDSELLEEVKLVLEENLFLPIVIVTAMIIATSYILKNPVINKWNTIILLCLMVIFIPKLNTVFLLASQYTFVVGRTITAFTFTLIMSASVYVMLYISKFFEYRKKLVSIMLTACIICMIILSSTVIVSTYDFDHVRIINENSAIAPSGLLECSEILEDYALEKGRDLVVLSPEFVYEDQFLTAFASMLRIKAPDVISLSAMPRYPDCVETSPYASYDQNNQILINDFLLEGKNYNIVQHLLNQYPVDCVITVNPISVDYLETLGFNIIGTSTSNTYTYYIMSNC